MRLGEVIRLDRSDLDTAEAIVTIRDSQVRARAGRSRCIPSTLDALADYARVRDQRCPDPRTPSLLISTAGTRLISQNVDYVFARLVRQAGLAARSDACRPRLHDFRHSLAVNTLLAWYRDGVDVQARLPLLSTLLGHANPANTYWYMSAVPELLALAAERRQTAASGPAHERPRPDPAGVLHRAAHQPAPRQRQHGGRLPGRLAAAAALRARPHRQAALPAGPEPTSTRTFIAGFLDHLEQDRGNSARTRNARLAAIRSFFRYAALCHPEHAALIARVLAIPAKRARAHRAVLPQPARSGRPAGRARPRHLDRPARPRPPTSPLVSPRLERRCAGISRRCCEPCCPESRPM